MGQMIRKIWNAFTTVLVAVVVFLAAALWGPRLLGMEVYTVLSGSMEPHFKTGSIIYVKDVEPDTLENGDIITFRISGSTIATHRIIDTVEENGVRMFRTKGDANDVEDNGLVEPGKILGEAFFTIPYLGFLAAYIQSKSGVYAVIAAGAAILLLVFIPDLLFPENKEKEKAK